MKKNEQGFALVLSLVFMLAMSLMGGALIVIAAGDHRSNNKSDEYQQTFYVEETALIEGEKYVLNKFLGRLSRVTSLVRVTSLSTPNISKSKLTWSSLLASSNATDKVLLSIFLKLTFSEIAFL